MRSDYRVVAVTPAGRRRYLDILLSYIRRDRYVIDEWHLWLNTDNNDDKKYCKELSKKHTWIKATPLKQKFKGLKSIHHFFESCIDEKTIYIRLDDDIVWIEKGGLRKLLDFRIANPQYFLVFPNIVNNSLMSHIHQRLGNITLDNGICHYKIMDAVGWSNWKTALNAHQTLLEKLNSGHLDHYKFHQWILFFNEKFSINSFAFFGKDFKKFNGLVGEDEEGWLTETKPRQSQLLNCVFGQCLMSHFAYYTQRKLLEQKSNILQQYLDLSKS